MKLKRLIALAAVLVCVAWTGKQRAKISIVMPPMPVYTNTIPRTNSSPVAKIPVEKFTFDGLISSQKALETGSNTTTFMVKHQLVTSVEKQGLQAIYNNRVCATRSMLTNSAFEFDLVRCQKADALDLISSLKANKSVVFVEEDGCGKIEDVLADTDEGNAGGGVSVNSVSSGCETEGDLPQVFPNDPFFAPTNNILIPYITAATYYKPAEQHHLYNTGGASELYSSYSQPYTTLTEPGVARQDISAPEGWAIRHDAPDVIIGMIDTGVDYRHQDLLPNLWTNTAANYVTGTNSPDIHGLLIQGRSDIPVLSGDIMDTYPHGTHTASVIGAVGNNNYGVCGVAWKTQILTIKPSLFSTIEMVAAIEYAVMRGAKIVNVSASSFLGSDALKSALQWAGEQGVVFTFATPNQNQNYDVVQDYPISWNLPNVIAVNYADKNGGLDPFVGWGPTNVFITSFARRLTVAQWLDRVSTENHVGPWPFITNGFTFNTGASFAAPQVAATIALVNAEHPGESIQEIRNRLRVSSRLNQSLVGKTVSAGTLDLYRALAWFKPQMTLNVTNSTLDITTSCIGRYWLETTTNLVASTWLEMGELTQTSMTITNAVDVSEPARYYRIRMDNE